MTSTPSTREPRRIKWFQPDRWDGNATYAQHAYIKGELGEAQAVCSSRRRLLDEDEMFMQFDVLDEELLKENAACKLCLKKVRAENNK